MECVCKKAGISKSKLAKTSKQLMVTCPMLTDRTASMVATQLLHCDKLGINADATDWVCQVDQNPSRSSLRQKSTPQVMPCVTPSGMYYIPKRATFMHAYELALAQGFSTSELIRALRHNVEDEKFVQDVVGHSFSTTTISAAIIVAWLSWLWRSS